jgi:PAS domain S-box-containing protein
MLTSFGGEELAVNAMKSGAMDYLPKGRVAAESLQRTVLAAIARFQMRRRIEEQQAATERNARQWQALLEAIPQMVWMADREGNIEFANKQWSDYTGQPKECLATGWSSIVHPADRERTLRAWMEARRSGTIFEVEHRLKRASDGTYRWHLVRAVPFSATPGVLSNWFGCCTEIENQKRAEALNLQKEKMQSIGHLAAGVAHDFNNLLAAIVFGASYAMECLPPSHPSQQALTSVLHSGERAAEITAKMLAYAGKGMIYMEPTDLNQLVTQTCESLRSTLPKGVSIRIEPAQNLPLLVTDARQMCRVIEALVVNAAEAIGDNGPGTISVSTRNAGPGSLELEVRDTGCGMSEDTQKRIFDPFFSTKFLGRGLGLAAVQGFVQSAGGSIYVDSAPGQGSRFLVVMPPEPPALRSTGTAA